MVHYDPKQWLNVFYYVIKWSGFRQIMKIILGIGIFNFLLTWYFLDLHHYRIESTSVAHSLLGIVLGLFLVFRTNTAYDRWWEGRKLWGALVNETRNLALKINAIFDDQIKKVYLRDLITAYVFAMKEHLRFGVLYEELHYLPKSDLDRIKDVDHKPNYLSGRIYEEVNSAYKNGEISGEQLFLLDKEIKAFTDIIGACERIKNTPIPFSYSVYIKMFILVYVVTLPFAFMSDFLYASVPITMVVSYILISIEVIGEEIEDPFGRDQNDLPTDELSEKILRNLREIIPQKETKEQESILN
ncbi:MAG: bestrophin family ion channel [Cytophagales bacterium]